MWLASSRRKSVSALSGWSLSKALRYAVLILLCERSDGSHGRLPLSDRIRPGHTDSTVWSSAARPFPAAHCSARRLNWSEARCRAVIRLPVTSLTLQGPLCHAGRSHPSLPHGTGGAVEDGGPSAAIGEKNTQGEFKGYSYRTVELPFSRNMQYNTINTQPAT